MNNKHRKGMAHVWLGTQGLAGVGHSRDTQRLGLWGSALVNTDGQGFWGWVAGELAETGRGVAA